MKSKQASRRTVSEEWAGATVVAAFAVVVFFIAVCW